MKLTENQKSAVWMTLCILGLLLCIILLINIKNNNTKANASNDKIYNTVGIKITDASQLENWNETDVAALSGAWQLFSNDYPGYNWKELEIRDKDQYGRYIIWISATNNAGNRWFGFRYVIYDEETELIHSNLWINAQIAVNGMIDYKNNPQIKWGQPISSELNGSNTKESIPNNSVETTNGYSEKVTETTNNYSDYVTETTSYYYKTEDFEPPTTEILTTEATTKSPPSAAEILHEHLDKASEEILNNPATINANFFYHPAWREQNTLENSTSIILSGQFAYYVDTNIIIHCKKDYSEISVKYEEMYYFSKYEMGMITRTILAAITTDYDDTSLQDDIANATYDSNGENTVVKGIYGDYECEFIYVSRYESYFTAKKIK